MSQNKIKVYLLDVMKEEIIYTGYYEGMPEFLDNHEIEDLCSMTSLMDHSISLVMWF